MTDIVERLRERARKAQVIEEHGLLSLAADEIDRLRAALRKISVAGLHSTDLEMNTKHLWSATEIARAALGESEP